MHTRRVATVALIVLLAGVLGIRHVGAQTNPASSDPGPRGWKQVDTNGIIIWAQNSDDSPGATGSGGPGGGNASDPCRWLFIASQSGGNVTFAGGAVIPSVGGGKSGGTSVANDASGSWYVQSCPGLDPQTIFVPLGPAGAAVVSPQQLAVQARNQIRPLAPMVQLSPAASHWQYVRVPTWAWVTAVSWTVLHATASVPGVTVTATATPVELDITYSDGDGTVHAVTCRGSGAVYFDEAATRIDPRSPIRAASPDCGWTYLFSSAGQVDHAVPVRARLVYHASWSVTGAPGGGDLGVVASPESAFSVQVAEIQALNVP